MEIDIPKGKYILAVSGGVDSVVLLDILRRRTDLELVVAHFNHGIRKDSDKDEAFVRQLAGKFNLTFAASQGKLGPGTSEARARQARYKFLEKTRQAHRAKSIITAHHQNDLVETALINTLRGTKRRGLTALSDNPKIYRPLLKFGKAEILAYAKKHMLAWREDSTNSDERYLRNYLRRRLNEFPQEHIEEFVSQIEQAKKVNQKINKDIATISHLLIENNKLKRLPFIQLPAEISREIMKGWLRSNGLAQTDKKTVDRATIFTKTGSVGSELLLSKTTSLRNSPHSSELWKKEAKQR